MPTATKVEDAVSVAADTRLYSANRIARLRQWIPLAFLAVMLGLLGIFNPQFYQNGNPLTVLSLCGILLMGGLGQTWVILFGSIDLSVGSMASLISIVFALTVPHSGLWAVVLSIAIGLVGGLLNGVVFAYVKIPSFIVTLGTGGIYLSLAYVFSNGSTIGITGGNAALQALESSLLGVPMPIVWVGILWIVFYIYQRFTTGGRTLYYVGSSEPAAWLSGVVVKRQKVLAFSLSGITAALMGILLAADIMNGSPNIGQQYLLQTIAGVVVGGTALTGGVGGVAQTLVGALIMAILSNGMNTLGVNAYYQNIVTGTVIVIAAMASLDRSKISMLK